MGGLYYVMRLDWLKQNFNYYFRMTRKKKMSFKLNPEWMLKEPLDFEYNKYTLLDYIHKS
jgi:hypothetical protein